jgi:pyruvate formate lyase activating enzyme
MLTVFNIQRYSIHDGNGVRTNIFFKGCPLRCLWCNNPESLDSAPSIMFDERICQQFGECLTNNGEIDTAADLALEEPVPDILCSAFVEDCIR